MDDDALGPSDHVTQETNTGTGQTLRRRPGDQTQRAVRALAVLTAKDDPRLLHLRQHDAGEPDVVQPDHASVVEGGAIRAGQLRTIRQ